MENDQLNNIFELNLNEEGKSNFSSIAQWALINAIVGFISLGMTMLSMFMAGSKLKSPGNAAGAGTSFLTIFISLIISLLLNITLLSAANHLKKGLAVSDQGHFNTGIAKLGAYFRIVGILTIIILVIVILVMLVVIIAGANGGFN